MWTLLHPQGSGLCSDIGSISAHHVLLNHNGLPICSLKLAFGPHWALIPMWSSAPAQWLLLLLIWIVLLMLSLTCLVETALGCNLYPHGVPTTSPSQLYEAVKGSPVDAQLTWVTATYTFPPDPFIPLDSLSQWMAPGIISLRDSLWPLFFHPPLCLWLRSPAAAPSIVFPLPASSSPSLLLA